MRNMQTASPFRLNTTLSLITLFLGLHTAQKIFHSAQFDPVAIIYHKLKVFAGQLGGIIVLQIIIIIK